MSGQYRLEGKMWSGNRPPQPFCLGASGNARQRRKNVRAWVALGYVVKPVPNA